MANLTGKYSIFLCSIILQVRCSLFPLLSFLSLFRQLCGHSNSFQSILDTTCFLWLTHDSNWPKSHSNTKWYATPFEILPNSHSVNCRDAPGPPRGAQGPPKKNQKELKIVNGIQLNSIEFTFSKMNKNKSSKLNLTYLLLFFKVIRLQGPLKPHVLFTFSVIHQEMAFHAPVNNLICKSLS